MQIPLWFERTLLAVGGLTLAIQFIPVSRTNPPVIKELAWDSPQTRTLAQRACYDCHSNEVRWPWYSYVAPMSWMIAQDVKDARERFNFSEVGPEDRAGILVEHIQDGQMPLPRYLALHREARLSDSEKKEYIAGLQRSFELSGLASKPEDEEHKHDHKHKH